MNCGQVVCCSVTKRLSKSYISIYQRKKKRKIVAKQKKKTKEKVYETLPAPKLNSSALKSCQLYFYHLHGSLGIHWNKSPRERESKYNKRNSETV